MASPTIGNSFSASPTPATNNPYVISGSVVQNSGSDRYMIIFLTYYAPNTTVGITGITYGGNTITSMPFNKIDSIRRGGLQQKMERWELVDAPANLTAENLSITWNQNINSPVSIHIRTFSDCGGLGAFIRNGASNTPNTKTITTTQDDSVIMMTSCSINAFNSSTGQQIPTGTNRSFITHNTNRQVATGANSGTTSFLSGTSVNCRAVVVYGTVSLDAFEILGVSTPPPTTRRIINVS